MHLEATLPRRQLPLVLFFFIVFLIVVSALPAIGQDSSGQLRVEPAPGSSTDPAGSYFLVKSRPGRTVQQRLQITNEFDRPVDLRLSPVDAITANTGGVGFELAGEPVDDEGSWINVQDDRLSLRPGRSDHASFSIEVPTETEPGVHLAGVAVELVEETSESATPQGTAIDVRARFVVAVQIDLPGDATPKLVIAGVKPVIRTDGVTLNVLIENAGFGLSKAEGVLELPDEGFEEKLPISTFVPGTSIRYPVNWLRDPAEGEYAARVELNYAEEDPELLTGQAFWEGTFTIGEGQAQELSRLQGDEGFNWLLVIVPALVLLLLIAFLLWRRRRRPKPTPPAPKPAPQPAPAPQAGYTGGYTGSAGGTFGSGTRPPQQTAPPVQQRPAGTPPPPPPPPKQGP